MPNLTAVLPADSAGTSGAEGPSYDEDYNLLNGDPETIVEKEEIEEDKEEQAEDIKAEGKEDEEQEEIEDEPVKIPFDRPSIKTINEKFPGFFKEFPELKDAIFREAKFTSFFPTIEDAKEAFDDNEAFTVLSDSALSGDSAPFLESIFKADPKAGSAFAASFLPNLYKKDQEAYSIAVTPLFENFLRQAFKSADENMKNSALNLAEFLWPGEGEASVTGKKTLSKANIISEEAKKAAERKEEDLNSSFRKAAAEVSTTVERSMIALISKDFDPDKVFTKTVRGMLIEKILKDIDKQLSFDAAHKAVNASRWKKARANGYQEADKSKLVAAYLARAKQLIPSVREKVRLDALGKSVLAKDKDKTPARREVNGGRDATASRARETKDYSKMTDLEILNS